MKLITYVCLKHLKEAQIITPVIFYAWYSTSKGLRGQCGLSMHNNVYLTYVLPVLVNCDKIDHIKNQL